MTSPIEHTIRWFEYETPPTIEVYGDHGDVVDYLPDYTGLPNLPVWHEALARVMATVDEARCDVAALMDDATGQMCANAIGWVLDEYEDYRTGRETARTVFRVFALVGAPGGVAAVCEDCMPHNLYENAALAGKP